MPDQPTPENDYGYDLVGEDDLEDAGPATVVADTPTFAQLNAVSVEHDLFSVTERGIEDLDPDGRHAGVAGGVWRDDGGPVLTDEGPLHWIRPSGDAWTLVTWAAQLRDGRFVPMHVAVRWSAMEQLSRTELPPETIQGLMDSRRRWLTRTR